MTPTTRLPDPRLRVAGAVLAAAALGWVLPEWMVFLLTVALAKGLVVLGVTLLMRAGLVSFGQGLFFGAGAYAVGFAVKALGRGEALLLAAAGALAGAAVAAATGFLVARYRGIFFGMLTLALSMAGYGVLVKAYHLTGGTDGLRIPAPEVAGFGLAGPGLRAPLYLVTLGWVGACGYLVYRYVQAPLGYVARAIRDNEIRVSYLGGSVEGAVLATFVMAGAMSGLGGALLAMAVGHVDPNLVYWTTSGEFVFVALLSGISRPFAGMAGSVFYEFAKAYAYKYAPYLWQLVIGLVMLAIVLFLPEGLSALGRGRRGGYAHGRGA